MFDPLAGDGLDFPDLARLAHAKRLYLVEAGEAPETRAVIVLNNDPQLLVRQLIRLAAIGHAFAVVARDEPERLVRGVRDTEVARTDRLIRAALAGTRNPQDAAA